MKIDISKFFTFIWMSFVGYLIYLILLDINYLTQLAHAYLSMAVESIQK
jgi:hypothetical protein